MLKNYVCNFDCCIVQLHIYRHFGIPYTCCKTMSYINLHFGALTFFWLSEYFKAKDKVDLVFIKQ